jgi:hypothetical protein
MSALAGSEWIAVSEAQYDPKCHLGSSPHEYFTRKHSIPPDIRSCAKSPLAVAADPALFALDPLHQAGRLIDAAPPNAGDLGRNQGTGSGLFVIEPPCEYLKGST